MILIYLSQLFLSLVPENFPSIFTGVGTPFEALQRQTYAAFGSKYPPAKPGALGCEPLKAAGKAAFAAYTLIKTQGSGKPVNSPRCTLARLLLRRSPPGRSQQRDAA